MECYFGETYVEWYGVSDFFVFSVVEIWVDYGSVNVFLSCFDLCSVDGVGVCVNSCGAVGVVCFFAPGCCLLCCDVVGMWSVVICIVSVMRVVGGIPSLVVCVLRRVEVGSLCMLCLLCTQLLYWVRCFVLAVDCWCLCPLLVVIIWCCCVFYVFVVCEFGVESQSYYVWVGVHGKCGVYL